MPCSSILVVHTKILAMYNLVGLGLFSHPAISEVPTHGHNKILVLVVVRVVFWVKAAVVETEK